MDIYIGHESYDCTTNGYLKVSFGGVRSSWINDYIRIMPEQPAVRHT